MLPEGLMEFLWLRIGGNVFSRCASLLPIKVGIVALTSHDSPETLVPSLVYRVVARLAEDDAIVQGIGAFELNGVYMMGWCTLTKLVLQASRLAMASYSNSAGCTPVLLANKRQFLS